jgi:hypothetical protein
MFGGFKKYRAVVNAMNAKLAWQDLDDRFKMGIESAAENLWMSGGRSADLIEDDQRRSKAARTIEGMREFQKWSLYAQAMEQMSLPPCLEGESWDNSRNPYVLNIKQKDILGGSEYFSRNHGVEVTLELD